MDGYNDVKCMEFEISHSYHKSDKQANLNMDGIVMLVLQFQDELRQMLRWRQPFTHVVTEDGRDVQKYQ